jgi:hypothetical protein
MQGFRLNGWQRIGIVLSALWVLVGGLWGRQLAVAPYFDCIKSAPNIDTMNFCERYLQDWGSTAMLIALVPLPIAWLLVYIVVWTVRWIRRGFQPAA